MRQHLLPVLSPKSPATVCEDLWIAAEFSPVDNEADAHVVVDFICLCDPCCVLAPNKSSRGFCKVAASFPLGRFYVFI